MSKDNFIPNNEYSRLLHEKEERQKELACINGTTKILNESRTVEDALQQVVQLLPQAWQFPESTSARIIYNNDSFITAGFIQSECAMKQEFFTIGNDKGIIEVFYKENLSANKEDPFLKEERDLIGNIASLITGFINSFKAREILGIQSGEDLEEETGQDITGKTLLNRFLRNYNANNDSLLYLFNYRRVKDILLVANLYDAYAIEGEGRLITNILNEFRHFDFSSPPRITGATNQYETLEKLRLRNYDLVIIMIGSQRDSQAEICNKIKIKYPHLPIFLLLTNPADIPFFNHFKDIKNNFDNFFIWTGDATVFLSMVTLLEDRINFDRDFKKGFTRAILLVEDSPDFYSTYLPILYALIMEQTKLLIGEGVTEDTKNDKPSRPTKDIIGYILGGGKFNF